MRTRLVSCEGMDGERSCVSKSKGLSTLCSVWGGELATSESCDSKEGQGTMRMKEDEGQASSTHAAPPPPAPPPPFTTQHRAEKTYAPLPSYRA